MMRILAFGFTVLALAGGAPDAQSDPQQVNLPRAWRSGERFHYVMEKEVRQAGWPRGRSRTPITLEVLARRRNSFQFGWTYGRAAPVSVSSRDREFVARLANVMEGIRLKLFTDRHLVTCDVINHSRVAAQIREAVDRLADWMQVQEMPRDAINDIRAEFKPLWARRTASMIMMREPMLLLIPLGRDYVAGERYTVRGVIDNPFPGGPIPNPVTLWLRKYEPKENRATIGWRQRVDPVEARKIIKESIIELARRMDREIRKDAKFPSLRFTATATTVLDTSTGLPITCRYQSRMTVDKKVSVERYRFRRSAGSARKE
jgi:hypothetical protein